jgi:mono/diheme cytochrome c family protein
MNIVHWSTRVGGGRGIAAGVLTRAALLAMQTEARAQVSEGEGSAVTFTRDIAPIFQQNCQECHQPGSIAPMSLVTYQDARRWATRIRQRVADRIMPPWHVNPYLGIQDFADEMAHAWVGVTTLTQEDYDRLVAELRTRRSATDN